MAQYHTTGNLVYVGQLWAFEFSTIWDGIDNAEDAGVSLGQIGQALGRNWDAVVVALAFGDLVALRALIATEVQS